MLILKVDAEPVYYNSISSKLRRVLKRHPIHVDLFRREGTIYFISLDDGFSVTFLYSAYLKAKEKDLKAELMYAKYIDPTLLPERIKELAEKWLSRGLSCREIEELKNINITEHVLSRWL